jgi:hypothetical protein
VQFIADHFDMSPYDRDETHPRYGSALNLVTADLASPAVASVLHRMLAQLFIKCAQGRAA